MHLARIAAPQSLPVHLDELKAAARIDHSEQDALLTSYLAEATDAFDGYAGHLGRALVTQTWRLTLACWPAQIRVPLLPVQSVLQVTYLDAGEVEQVFSDWRVIENAGWTLVEPTSGFSWPTIADRDDAVGVEFVAGYGDPGDVPQTIRGAILLWAARRYDGQDVEDAKRMASQYKVHAV